MNVRYVVELTEEERAELRELVSGGSKRVLEVKRAQVLLASAEGVGEAEVATSVRGSKATIYRVKRRFVEGGLTRALNDKPRPGGRRKLSGKEEALLVGRLRATPLELASAGCLP